MGNPTLLIDNDTSSNQQQENIWICCADGDLQTTKLLIESGQFQPSAQDDNGYSLLHAASSYNHIDIAQFLLLKDNSLIHLLDEDGDTPLHAVESVEMANFLLNAGATPNPLNHHGQTPLDLAIEDDRFEVIDFFKALYTRLGIEFQIPEPESSDMDDQHIIHVPLPSSSSEVADLDSIDQAQLHLAVEDLVMCQLGLNAQEQGPNSDESESEQ